MIRKYVFFVSALVLSVVLSACNSTGNDPGPGGVTKAEAESLDAAAKKLESEPQIPEHKVVKNTTTAQ